MVQERDIGRRVVVRHRLDVPVGGARFTDVTGRLDAVTDKLLRVGRDDGSSVDIPQETVVASKVIPPKRASHTAVADYQEICDAAWPASDTAWLGRWRLRSADGFTRRANSVLVLGDPGIDVDSAVLRVRDFYAARNRPAGFSLAQPLTRRLDRALAAEGWHKDGAALVQTTAIKNIVAPSTAAIATAPDHDWLRLAYEDTSLPEAATSILGWGPRRGFASITVDATVVAVGRVALEGTVAVISSVKVDPKHRRHGLAADIVAGLAAWAASHRAAHACVQVEEDNAGARALYERLGFTTHHTYHYRWAPAVSH